MLDRIQRHILEQTVVSAPGLQILDVPKPQMGDQLVDVLKIIDTSLPVFTEQVIDVPKVFLQDTIPQCSAGRSWRNSWWECRRFLRHPVSSSSFLPSRPLTFQFMEVSSVLGEGFEVLSQDRVPQRSLEHRSLEVYKVLSQDRVQQRFLEQPNRWVRS